LKLRGAQIHRSSIAAVTEEEADVMFRRYPRHPLVLTSLSLFHCFFVGLIENSPGKWVTFNFFLPYLLLTVTNCEL